LYSVEAILVQIHRRGWKSGVAMENNHLLCRAKGSQSRAETWRGEERVRRCHSDARDKTIYVV
jgi:hypothetical protein